MRSRYGQHLARIDRQRACEHRWGPWRPYGNPEYGLMRRECAVCWADEALTRQELEEDGVALAPNRSEDTP